VRGISALPATLNSTTASSRLVPAASFIPPEAHIAWSFGYGPAERCRLAAGVDASVSGCTTNSISMNVTLPGHLTRQAAWASWNAADSKLREGYAHPPSIRPSYA